MQRNGGSTLFKRDWCKTIQKCWCLNLFISNRRMASTRNKNHYDVLGISPAATQADIKSAYYTLSMKYHPDKCIEEDAKGKFRLITEAYEVLGNIRLKKLYDKGLLARQRVYQPQEAESEPTDPTLKFYKSRERRHVVPVMKDSNTPIYDFDAWTKNHYSKTFRRGQWDRSEVKRKAETKVRNSHDMRDEIWTWTVLFFIVSSVIFFSDTDYDSVKPQGKTGD